LFGNNPRVDRKVKWKTWTPDPPIPCPKKEEGKEKDPGQPPKEWKGMKGGTQPETFGSP